MPIEQTPRDGNVYVIQPTLTTWAVARWREDVGEVDSFHADTLKAAANAARHLAAVLSVEALLLRYDGAVHPLSAE